VGAYRGPSWGPTARDELRPIWPPLPIASTILTSCRPHTHASLFQDGANDSSSSESAILEPSLKAAAQCLRFSASHVCVIGSEWRNAVDISLRVILKSRSHASESLVPRPSSQQYFAYANSSKAWDLFQHVHRFLFSGPPLRPPEHAQVPSGPRGLENTLIARPIVAPFLLSCKLIHLSLSPTPRLHPLPYTNPLSGE
jgi:hypothetical protein